MTSAYVFEIDGYEIPRGDVPARGPIVERPDRRWAETPVLGDVMPGTILTHMSAPSQSWEYESRATEATKDKYLAVYNAKQEVIWKTPQNTTGFNVVMTHFNVVHEEPIEDGKFLCRFRLVYRSAAEEEEDVATIIRKAVNQTVNNNDTLQDDDELLLAVGANEIWLFRFMLAYVSGGAPPGFKAAFTIPAGATGFAWHLFKDGTPDVQFTLASTLTTVVSAGSAAATWAYEISGIIVVGATAGDLQLQWAQASATVGDTILAANSYLIAHRQS